jgi:hypothetical protein
VEWIPKRPGITVPFVVIPLNGSASPRVSASRDLRRKASARSSGVCCWLRAEESKIGNNASNDKTAIDQSRAFEALDGTNLEID